MRCNLRLIESVIMKNMQQSTYRLGFQFTSLKSELEGSHYDNNI